MSPYNCDQEERTIQAVQSGTWDGQLRQHAASCDLCAEIVLVATALCEDATLANAESALPDAATVWRKAQLERQRRDVARATWPIALVWRLAYLFSGLLLLWLFFRSDAPGRRAIDAIRGGLPILHPNAAASLNSAVLACLLSGSVGLVCVLLGSLYIARADA
jgi:ABC-type sulfate transport system permease component